MPALKRYLTILTVLSTIFACQAEGEIVEKVPTAPSAMQEDLDLLPESLEDRPSDVLEMKLLTVIYKEEGFGPPKTDLFLQFPSGQNRELLKVGSFIGRGSLQFELEEQPIRQGRLFDFLSWWAGGGDEVTARIIGDEIVISSQWQESLSPEIYEAMEAEGNPYEPPPAETLLTLPLDGHKAVMITETQIIGE